METHKPKPWRGPGEFFREILIIVVGVLIALSGEQAVEWMHRQNELAETREALREEIAQNAGIVVLGAAMDRCRSVTLEKYADWAHGGPRPETVPAVAIPDLNFSVWRVATAGPLSRMPVKERLTDSLIYDSFEKHQKNTERQIDLALALTQFTRQENLNLDHDQAQRVLELSTAVKTIIAVKDRYFSTLQNDVQTLGISLEPLSEYQRKELSDLCQAAGVPVPTL